MLKSSQPNGRLSPHIQGKIIQGKGSVGDLQQPGFRFERMRVGDREGFFRTEYKVLFALCQPGRQETQIAHHASYYGWWYVGLLPYDLRYHLVTGVEEQEARMLYFRPKSAGISIQSTVFHLYIGLVIR